MPFQSVEWAKGQKARFRDWIQNEIAQVEGDRASLERKWQDLIIQHRARVIGDGVGDVPFVGSSDIDFPLTSIHTRPVYADLMQTLHIPRDFWSIVATRDDTVNIVKPLQEFMSFIERSQIKMRVVNQRAFLDLIVLGTCVYKDDIRHLAVSRKDYDESGNIVTVPRITFTPSVKHIQLQDFFIPAYSWRIDPNELGGAPWVSERFELTRGQLRERAQGESPFAPNYDKDAVETVLRHIDGIVENRVQETQRREDRYEPFQDHKARLHEVWARFDVNGDDIDEDVRIIWHQPTATILQAIHSPLMHGRRPFSRGVYEPGFGFYGVGLAESDEWAQLTMSRLLNSAVNNTLVSNAAMIQAPLGSNISPDEPIYPGKIWLTGPNEQMKALQLGSPYPQIFTMMGTLMQWAEQRTGVSEMRQGDVSSLPSRTPASSVLSIMQEGSKTFDMVLSNLREDALNDIGARCLQNLVQISKVDPRYIAMAYQVLGARDGDAVAQVLSGPIQDIEDKFGVNVTATTSQVNKEVEKQSYVGLAQMVAQFYPQLMQYAQVLTQMSGDPTIMLDTIQSAYTGSTELMKRTLETFDIQNPEQYLPSTALQTNAAQAGQGATPGAPVAPATAPLGGTSGPSPVAQGEDLISSLLGIS